MSALKKRLLERFLRYVAYDTQSDEGSETYPSTAKQLLLLNDLVEEMMVLGLEDVEIDGHGYVMGAIPATTGAEAAPVVGFLAHVDTSPDVSGANVRPQVIEHYNGGSVSLGESNFELGPGEFPELRKLAGHTIITTDGTTLLGADDKAGVAIIMTLAEYLLVNKNRDKHKHGRIRIGFTPDEEIGRGVDYFDVGKFGATYAYTVDGGELGELEYENFNAAWAKLIITGKNIHPGMAKGKMVNAIQVAAELHAMLPLRERPENTEGYEGFYHPVSIRGDVGQAELEYILRDHSREKFEGMKARLEQLAAGYNERYDPGTITLEIRDQYYNMRGEIEGEHMVGVERARRAMEEVGVRPVVRPIRGGTDGARLSFMGLPCPNLFTGGGNFHGKYEYVSLDVMELSVRTLIKLVELWAE